MANVLVTTFVSLDGVMQAPGGGDEDPEGGFAHGGWLVPHFDERLGEVMVALTQRASALLLGRKTYDIFAASWPLTGDDDPIGSKLNAMPKYVASRSQPQLSWHNSTQLSGDVPAAITALKRDLGGEIQVHGSADLLRTVIGHDLVDEYHLVIFPVVLGGGKRLFENGAPPATFTLTASSTTSTGVLLANYRRAGDVTYGAMGPETGNW